MDIMTSIRSRIRRFPDDIVIENDDNVVTNRNIMVLAEALRCSNGRCAVLPKLDRVELTMTAVAACMVAGVPYFYSDASDIRYDYLVNRLFVVGSALLVDVLGNKFFLLEYSLEFKSSFVFNDKLITLARSSGSTGTPKLIPIFENNYRSFLIPACRNLKMDRSSRVGDFANLPSDLSFTNFFMCLFLGCVWVPLSSWRDKTFPLMASQKKSITHIRAVSSAALCILKDFERNAIVPDCLEVICFGGERLMAKTVSMIYRNLPDVDVINSYGTTEIGGFCTANLIEKDDSMLSSCSSLSIGIPFDGFHFSVNEKSELICSGSDITSGYLLVEELNVKFMSHPVSELERVEFNSRDVVSVTSGSSYEIIGRTDCLFKQKGRFIDFDKIESDIFGDLGVTLMLVSIGNKVRCLVEGEALRLDLENRLKKKFKELNLDVVLDFNEKIPRTPSGKKNRIMLMNNMTK